MRKAAPDDICIVIEATNHGPDTAPLHVLPQVWFRNTGDGAVTTAPGTPGAVRSAVSALGQCRAVRSRHDYLGEYFLSAEGVPEVLVCDNETDAVALWAQRTTRRPTRRMGSTVASSKVSATRSTRRAVARKRPSGTSSIELLGPQQTRERPAGDCRPRRRRSGSRCVELGGLAAPVGEYVSRSSVPKVCSSAASSSSQA